MDNGTIHNCKKINGHRKIVSYRYLAHTFSGYAADVTFGHGTHVAGTIAGNVMSSVASEEEYARKYNGFVIDYTYAVYAERVPTTLPWWSVALCSAYRAWCVNAEHRAKDHIVYIFKCGRCATRQRNKEQTMIQGFWGNCRVVPAAKLAVDDLSPDGVQLNLPADLSTGLWKLPYEELDVRVHSNSWGAPSASYTSEYEFLRTFETCRTPGR
jgi:subtilisin family serine protease